MKDYNKRLNSLRNRRTDSILNKAIMSDSFSKTSFNESIKYVLESMEPVNPNYTVNCFGACEKIQNNIKTVLDLNGYNVEFRYQGSVPLNTHIKLHSDTDQIVITNRYETLQPPQIPNNPYNGNPIDDLLNIRTLIVSTISQKMPAVRIDNHGSKSIAFSGGSLNRKIDVIPANWFISNKYLETNDQDFKGIQILDKSKNERIVNYPFLFIWWINNKDNSANGNLKRLIRFMKNLKADFNNENKEQIKISSYDVSSLLFRMDDIELNFNSGYSLNLLINCFKFFNKVINNFEFRDSLYTANGTRKIFCSDGAKLSDLTLLNNELKEIIDDLNISVRPLYENIQKSYYLYN